MPRVVLAASQKNRQQGIQSLSFETGSGTNQDINLEWDVSFRDFPRSREETHAFASIKSMGYSILSPFIFAASMLHFGITVRKTFLLRRALISAPSSLTCHPRYVLDYQHCAREGVGPTQDAENCWVGLHPALDLVAGLSSDCCSCNFSGAMLLGYESSH